jgi:hypothetical protein
MTAHILEITVVEISLQVVLLLLQVCQCANHKQLTRMLKHLKEFLIAFFAILEHYAVNMLLALLQDMIVPEKFFMLTVIISEQLTNALITTTVPPMLRSMET